MPADLLEFVSGPPRYSMWWLWSGVALTLLVILWYTTVFVATLPSSRLRRLPVLRAWHSQVLRRRFARTVAGITRRHLAGETSQAAASAALAATLRSFLHQATGRRAQYLQLRALADSELAAAHPVLAALGDAQFGTSSSVDVGRLGEQTEKLIRSWS